MKQITLLLSLTLLLNFQAYNQDFSLNKTLPTDPAVKMGQLKNGLKYFIKENAKPENRVELRLAIKAGSLQEDDDQLGIAHFVEHMAFNGTENFEKNDLIKYLESTGIRFGADLNAYTSFAETVYMLQARTDAPQHLDTALLILEDWASGLLFEPEEVDKERGVIISEWRTSLSPQQRLQQKFLPILYENSRYAKRLPIGSPDTIENVTPAVVKRFYDDWYRPDLMALIVVGDIDEDEIEKEIIKRFSSLRAPRVIREKEEYEVPLGNETRFAIFSDEEMPFTQIQLELQQPSLKLNTIGDYRQLICQNLYNRMLNSRMQEIQRLPDPPFTFAYSGYGQDLGNLNSYTISAFVEEGGALKGLAAVYKSTRQALLYGFNDSELERQKQDLLSALEKGVAEQDKTNSANLASRYVNYFVDEGFIPSPEQSLKLHQELLASIKVEEINKLPKGWLDTKSRVFVVTGPKKEAAPLPTQDELLNVLDSVEQLQLKPFEDKVIDAPLLDKALSTTPIIAEKHIDSFNITALSLENGVKIVLKPTDFKNDEILLSGFSAGGHSIYPDSLFRSADIASFLVRQSGVGKFDFLELEKLLAGKNVSVSPYIGELNEGFSGNATTKELETMLQLIYLYFTEPRMDKVHFESFMRRQRNTVKNMYENPYYSFADNKTKIKYNNHPRKQTVKAENLDLIDEEVAFKIYKDRFADASDFTFILVGNFEVEKIKPILSAYLGNLPSINRKETWRDVKAGLAKGRIDTTFYGGQAPKSLVEIVYHGEIDYNNNNRYAFSSLVTIFKDRLMERLREEKGSIYSISVRPAAQQNPSPTYRITITFNCRPTETEEVIALIDDEAQKIQIEGIKEAELARVKEKQLQSRILGLKENGFWLTQLTVRYRESLGFDNLPLWQYKAMQEALSNEEIKQAAKVFLSEGNYMKMVLKPAFFEVREKK